MIRFAYLILAHDKPKQLAALVARLCPPGSADFAVIHIDAKSPLAPEAAALAATNPAVRLVPRPVAVRWGHASQLEATRRLLRAALSEDFTHAHLLSGSDWPIASRARIAADISDRCWIEAVPGMRAERMTDIRLDSRMLQLKTLNPFTWRLARGLRWLSGWLPPRTRQPWGPWHKGSQWWSLPRDVCAHVLGELDKGFAKGHFRFTVCCDEHAIQTIAACHFADRLAGARRYIVWSEGASHPEWLTANDWPAAKASDAWFARKVDEQRDDFFYALPPH